MSFISKLANDLFVEYNSGWCSINSYSLFFNDTATTEIYTLSLHDALPISSPRYLYCQFLVAAAPHFLYCPFLVAAAPDRKSTHLNSSHTVNSYAVFCLKKKKISNSTKHSQHTFFVKKFGFLHFG